MYLKDYIWFIFAILLCAIFSGYASIKVKTTYEKYGKIANLAGITGYDTAILLLRSNGVSGISVGRVNGYLTDHYHPAKNQVNLSESTFGSNSIAAVAVAAHEIGHVVQNKKGYLFYKIRTAIFPIVNIGSRLAIPLVVIGLIIDLLAVSVDSPTGFYIAMVGVILYAFAFLFTLVTLPVEINASKRAKQMLIERGILTRSEIEGATKVLNAAALTYLASLLTSLVYFLRFMLMVLTLFGRRNSRR